MTVEDWEVGALYWRLVDEAAGPEEARDRRVPGPRLNSQGLPPFLVF